MTKKKSVTINNATVSETVVLINLVPCKLICGGPVTGQIYTFERPGSAVKVAKEDAEIMLTKRKGDTCCGGTPSPMFELAV